jgi:hypothetical protein
MHSSLGTMIEIWLRCIQNKGCHSYMTRHSHRDCDFKLDFFFFFFFRSENKGRRGEGEFQTGLISGFLGTLAMLTVPA